MEFDAIREHGMVMKLKDYIGNQFVGKRLRISGGCCISEAIEGYCVEYTVISGEVVLHIQTEAGKIYQFGENHPDIEIEII